MPESIFPRVEEWLNNTTNQKIAALIIDDDLPYRSMVDAVLCAMSESMKHFCRNFYDGRAKQVKDLFSGKEGWLAEEEKILRKLEAYRRSWDRIQIEEAA